VSQPREIGDAEGTQPTSPSHDGPSLAARVRGVLRYLDVALVAVAIVVALAYGAPALGVGFGAGGWIVQRVLGEVDRRWVRNVKEPRTQLGVTLFEGFARIWLLAIVIIIAALVGGRADGLTAALMICGAYTVALAIKVISGPPNRRVSQ